MPSKKARKAVVNTKKNKKAGIPSSKFNATALVRVLNVPRGMSPLFLYREFLGEDGFGTTILDIEICRGFPSGSRTASTYIFISSASAAQSVAKKLKGISGRIKGDLDIRNARLSLKVEVLDDVSEAADKYVYQGLSDYLDAEGQDKDLR
ncbi:hypothetical protein DPSP01_004208 [Paraphaeosphaeria sporulosa]